MHEKVVIIGAGGHSRVIRDILGQYDMIDIIGYTDLNLRNGMNISYLGDDSSILEFSPDEIYLANGLGSVSLPKKHKTIYERFISKGYKFINIIHRRSILTQKVKMGEGVQVMAGVVINTGTIINDNTIINTSVTIEHECIIGAHSHIATAATLCGEVEIGECCHIGAGATIIQGVKIGDNTLIGAGALVLSDMPPSSKAFGVPAKLVK